MRELASICPLSADCAKVAVKKVWNWILKQTNQYECALESMFRTDMLKIVLRHNLPTRDIGANGGGDRQHIQNRAFFSINRSIGRGEARRVRRPRLWLWSRMAQLTLSTKYVTVEVCNHR